MNLSFLPKISLPKTLSVLILYTTFASLKSVHIPANPCPNVFKYVQYSNGNTKGMITLPNNGEGYINLEVNVSLATDNKNAKVTMEREEQDLTDCKPSVYYLNLPFSNNLPRITRIYFNGNVICSGPSAPLVPGGKAVWNIWNQNKYQTTELFSCQNTRNSEEIRTVNDLKFPLNTLDTPGRPIIPNTPQPFIPPPRHKPNRRVSRGHRCGISKGTSQVTPLSLGGKDVSEGEFPWMAALMHRNDESTISFVTTVTLVSLRYVITTGHCIDMHGLATLDANELLVVLGTKNISDWLFNNVVLRKVSNVILKLGIEPGKASNDIALIQMDKTVPYIPGEIVPICLWHGNSDTNDNSLDELILLNPGTVVGFGDTNKKTKILNKVQVPVVTHLMCFQSLTLPVKLVEDNTFCGGYSDGQTGTCDTDTGASFGVQKVEGGPWYLRGILSVTPALNETQCNLKGYSLYVDLAEHYQWLHDNIDRKQF